MCGVWQMFEPFRLCGITRILLVREIRAPWLIILKCFSGILGGANNCVGNWTPLTRVKCQCFNAERRGTWWRIWLLQFYFWNCSKWHVWEWKSSYSNHIGDDVDVSSCQRSVPWSARRDVCLIKRPFESGVSARLQLTTSEIRRPRVII